LYWIEVSRAHIKRNVKVKTKEKITHEKIIEKEREDIRVIESSFPSFSLSLSLSLSLFLSLPSHLEVNLVATSSRKGSSFLHVCLFFFMVSDSFLCEESEDPESERQESTSRPLAETKNDMNELMAE
jgi:hypothetical protein